jgi:raffinose/stachyose/melibiose transport system substrate-binding protein
MIMMGGPQFRPDWDSLMGEYFDGEIDSETLRDRMRAFNMGNLEDNLKGGRLELSDLDHPERKPPER